MKTILNIIILLVLLTPSVCSVKAQQIDTAAVKNRCRQEVAMLNSYIEGMARKGRSDASKQDLKNSALTLFINDGKAYTEIIERKNGERTVEIHKDGVMMQLSKLIKKRINNRLIEETLEYNKPIGNYFDALIKFPYYSVEIQTTEIKDMQVGEIYQLNDGQYVCSVYFDQKFVGKMKDGRTYQDITHKYVICYVDVVHTPTGKNEYFVRLGDIKVGHTDSVK